MKPKAFVLYPNQWGPLSCLSNEQLGRLMRHIFLWMNDQTDDDEKAEANVEPDILLPFRFMRLQIDIDIEKYEKKSEKNKQYYQKLKEKNSVKFSQIQTNSDIKENEKEKEIENEKENEKENRRRDSSSSSVISEKAANEEEDEEEEDSLIFEKAEKQWLPWFNKLLDDNASAIPRMRKMTMERAKAMKSLADKYGNDALLEVLRRAAQNSFLNGRSKRSNFVADIDWLLKEENFMKVYENKFFIK